MIETEKKCMMCDISLECTLTRNVRDLCEGVHKNGYYNTKLMKSNLGSRLRAFFQKSKFKFTTQ